MAGGGLDCTGSAGGAGAGRGVGNGRSKLGFFSDRRNVANLLWVSKVQLLAAGGFKIFQVELDNLAHFIFIFQIVTRHIRLSLEKQECSLTFSQDMLFF